jgi:hypothetical protein
MRHVDLDNARRGILNVLRVDTYARERENLLAWRDVMEESLPELDAWDKANPRVVSRQSDDYIKRMLELSIEWEKVGLGRTVDRDGLARAILAEIEKIKQERAQRNIVQQQAYNWGGPVGSGNL